MPGGPNGGWRPADVVGCAVYVAKIATGELKEDIPTKHQQDSRKGGYARAKNSPLSAGERSPRTGPRSGGGRGNPPCASALTFRSRTDILSF